MNNLLKSLSNTSLGSGSISRGVSSNIASVGSSSDGGFPFLNILILFILGFIIYVVFTSYKSGSGSGIMGYTLVSIIVFGLYILIGLNVTNTEPASRSGIVYIMNWLAYTLLAYTIAMIILLAYFWSVIQKKSGPTGVRGIVGDKGNMGVSGKCGVDAHQYQCMQLISQHIDKLFGDKTNGKSIYDPLVNKFKNDYMTEKINTMCTSNQFKVLVEVFNAEKRSVKNLYDYMRQIWGIWFEELWKGGGEQWFMDKYADENYDWIDEYNPFDEIHKYDIYHWGLTDLFRPLKAEICRNTADTKKANMPYKQEPLLRIVKSNDYKWIYNDNHSKAAKDITSWRAKPVEIANETYYPVGDVLSLGYETNIKKNNTIVGTLETKINDGNGPDKTTILVAGDVKEPIRYSMLWSDWDQARYGVFKQENNKWRNGGGNQGSLLKPIAPDGYTCLGDVFVSGDKHGDGNRPGKKDSPKIMCVPSKCVTKVNTKENKQWAEDNTSNAKKYQPRFVDVVGINDIDSKDGASNDNAYNLIRARNARNNPNIWNGSGGDYGFQLNRKAKYNSDPLYIIKDECLTSPDIVPKDVQPEVAKLGLAWHGDPVKYGEKYSIFSFLDLVPEGLAVNRANGRNYYIVHYGGTDINKYLLLVENPDTHEFTRAVQSSPIIDNDKVITANKQEDNPLQQWIIKIKEKSRNKNEFNLINVRTGKMLYISLEPSTGFEIFKSKKNGNSADLEASFLYKSASGVNLERVNSISGKKNIPYDDKKDGKMNFDKLLKDKSTVQYGYTDNSSINIAPEGRRIGGKYPSV
jgi:hypothetical protein